MNIYIPNPFRKKKPLETTRKQPETLIMAIDHHMNRHSGWTVKICVVDAKKLKPFPTLTTTVAEFAPVCADVEAYIREEFGAGEFRIEIYEPTGQIAGKYSVPVGGPKAYRQPGVGGTDKGGAGEGILTGQLAAFAQVRR